MGLLKRWMTEILLDVTDTEMRDVAIETIQFEKGKSNLVSSKISFKIEFLTNRFSYL